MPMTTGREPKLTEAQRDLLRRSERGLRIFGKRESNSVDILERRGFIRYAAPGYGADFYITDAGRAALSLAGEKL